MKLTEKMLKKMIKEVLKEAQIRDPQAGSYETRHARSQQIMKDKAAAGVYSGAYASQQEPKDPMVRAVELATMALDMAVNMGVQPGQYDLLSQAAAQGNELIRKALEDEKIYIIGQEPCGRRE